MGRITGYNITDHVLAAGQGQQMTVDFAPDNPFAYFNVLKRDDSTALFVGSSKGSGPIALTGEFPGVFCETKKTGT